MPNITIIDGRACTHAPSSPERLVVRMPARLGRGVPHQLIRALVPALRQALGTPAFASFIARWRAPLSVVLTGLEPQLSEPERGLAHRSSARLTSHLTHNLPMHERLWQSYAELIREANAAVPLTLVVDDLCQLDVCSFSVIEQVFRSAPDQAPDVVAGHASDHPARPAMDERGILWDLGVADLAYMLGVLRRLPGRVEFRQGQPSPCRCPAARDPWDLCPAQRVEQLLARGAPQVSAAEAAEIAPALRQIFASFAFDTSLQLALGVIDAGLPISTQDRAVVHGLAAVSAHNRQFSSDGNLRIAHFLRDALREVLACEADPGRRISAHYRLAVTYCRRLGDVAHARQAIEDGLSELGAAGLSAVERGLQEAWLRNIDAFVRVREGNLSAAFGCCEQAFAALAGIGPSEQVSVAEVELSKLVLCENALTLAAMTHDEPRRDVWLARTKQGIQHWPSLTVVEVLEQQRAHLQRLEVGAAHERALAARELARAKLNPLLEYIVLVSLSDLSFRMADHGAAAAYSDAALTLTAELGDVNRTQRALEVRATEIAEALGQLEVAARALRAMLTDGAPVELQVDVVGRLARVCARQGEREQALELTARSIDLAADSGVLDLLLRASCDAGDVACLLGSTEDAGAAYASCLELLETAPVATPTRSILRLRATVGQARLGLADPTALARCVRGLPRLMAEARDAWPLARELMSLLGDGWRDAEVTAALRVVQAALAGCGATSGVVASAALAAHA